jgi:hypothetical protein
MAPSKRKETKKKKPQIEKHIQAEALQILQNVSQLTNNMTQVVDKFNEFQTGCHLYFGVSDT